MSGYVLFHMSEGLRKSLISGHLFYVEEARKRLLSQFDAIELESDKTAEDWLERSNSWFDPDRNDPASFHERANDVAIEFYRLLSDMRDRTWLSVIAGMFHEWDKQFRGWLVREIERWHRGESFSRAIWAADFSRIGEFLDCLGWDFSRKDHYQKLDECRLVVNVYKHGDGKSLDDLKARCPEFLEDRFLNNEITALRRDFRDHTDLKIGEKQFQAISDAIVEFWNAIPEYTRESETETPTWVQKAISKDQERHQQPSKQ